MNINTAENSEKSQRELAAGVLQQAAQDLRRFRNATSKVESELYFDAYSWAVSDDCSWPFSFLNVCRILNRTPEELRRQLVGELSIGFFRRVAQCCSRGVRRVSDSLLKGFAAEYSAIPSARMIQPW